jgi:hypothetical protein
VSHTRSVQLGAVTESADQRRFQQLVEDEPTTPMVLVDAIAGASHLASIPLTLVASTCPTLDLVVDGRTRQVVQVAAGSAEETLSDSWSSGLLEVIQ